MKSIDLNKFEITSVFWPQTSFSRSENMKKNIRKSHKNASLLNIDYTIYKQKIQLESRIESNSDTADMVELV